MTPEKREQYKKKFLQRCYSWGLPNNIINYIISWERGRKYRSRYKIVGISPSARTKVTCEDLSDGKFVLFPKRLIIMMWKNQSRHGYFLAPEVADISEFTNDLENL